MKRWLSRMLNAVPCLLILVTGCCCPAGELSSLAKHSTPTPQTSQAVVLQSDAAEYVEYARPDDGFAVSLPDTWTVIDMDAESTASIISSVAEWNPELASQFTDETIQDFIASGIKLLAYDFDPELLDEDLGTTMQVIKQQLPSALSLSVCVQMNVATLEKLPGVETPISRQLVKLGSLDAYELRYGMLMKGPDSEDLDLEYVQYCIVNGKQFYVITFATFTDLIEVKAPEFESIASTFRLLP